MKASRVFSPLSTMAQLTRAVQQRELLENIGVLRKSTVTEITTIIGITVGQHATLVIRKIQKLYNVSKFFYSCNTEVHCMWQIYLIIDKECTTIAGPAQNTSCIFPFIFDVNTYYGCVADGDESWCSTKVDINGVHIGGKGNWGICDPDCTSGIPNKSRRDCIG